MNYYRKNVNNNVNDLKLNMRMSAFTLKLSENINKINDLLKTDKDIKKDISNNYYDKNEIDLKFNNLYNKTYIDHKLDDIYDKTEINDKNSKLNRDIVLFNTNLTDHIDKYSNEKQIIDKDIKENKSKLDKFSYYIKEFFIHNIDLVRRFEITSEKDYIQILQFEVDRKFLVNDIIKFFISIKLLYENMSQVYWTLYFKMDVHYKDDVLIKSFKNK